VILADEPVASLDPATSENVLRYLREIGREDGLTVLCNLHLLDLARRYADRVVALRSGEIVFDGPPEGISDERFDAIYGGQADLDGARR
jgi:phosphonate transport system ATP-binding protein